MPEPAPRSRIELVVPALHTGGMEVMVVHLARALHHRGRSVGITCLEEEGALAAGARQQGISVTVVPTRGLRTLAYPGKLAGWFRNRAQVVHLHNGTWVKGGWAARLAGVSRVVGTFHGLPDRVPLHERWLTRLGMGFTNHCAAVSEPLQRYLVREVGVPGHKVSVLPNGVDTARFSPATSPGDLRHRLGLGQRAALIGTVARLAPVKNHELLLRAFAGVRARIPDVALAIVGDGPLRETLEARVRGLGLTGAVHFTGELADTAAVYRSLDIFVLTSIAEGTSISMLEAMASGTCVVATDVGGNSALLAGGAAGRLVPSGEPEPLTAALIELLEDQVLRNALGRAARERAVISYSHEHMVDLYEAMYGSRLARQEPHHALVGEGAR